jgi:hypothetical protein
MGEGVLVWFVGIDGVAGVEEIWETSDCNDGMIASRSTVVGEEHPVALNAIRLPAAANASLCLRAPSTARFDGFFTS